MQLRPNAGKGAPRAQVSSRKSHRAGRWGRQQSRRGRPGERAPSAGTSWQGQGTPLPGQPWTRLKEARVNSHRHLTRWGPPEGSAEAALPGLCPFPFSPSPPRAPLAGRPVKAPTAHEFLAQPLLLGNPGENNPAW